MASTKPRAARPGKSRPPMTVDGYIAGLPEDRRRAVTTLRKLILKNLPKGYAEGTGYGMICYTIPLKTYPETYNGQPLCYLALASQKQHLSLYTMNLYGDAAALRDFKEEFRKAGLKLNMGKSCIRFRSLDELPLPVIAKVVASTPVKKFIAMYEKSRK